MTCDWCGESIEECWCHNISEAFKNGESDVEYEVTSEEVAMKDFTQCQCCKNHIQFCKCATTAGHEPFQLTLKGGCRNG